jgi:hypothetical protein
MPDAALSKAISEAADQIHDEWRQEYRAANGDKPRWKPLNAASEAWINEMRQTRQDAPVPETALRTNPQTGKKEIDIAGLPNRLLPPQHSGENTAAAAGAIEAIIASPDADLEAIAATLHDQWVARNSSWVPDNMKVPYAELPENEKEKDRAIARVAAAAAFGRRLAPPGALDFAHDDAKPA